MNLIVVIMWYTILYFDNIKYKIWMNEWMNNGLVSVSCSSIEIVQVNCMSGNGMALYWCIAKS